MPYTVAVSFDTFYENINLSGDHRDIANTRRDAIVSILKNNFDVLDSFATGSIPRYTALKNGADLDVIVVLHFGKHIKNKKPSEVLQSVRDVLAEYRTNVRKNGQAVTLHYTTWPSVDIVPAAHLVDDAGEVTSYKIPNMNEEEWIITNPKTHSENILEKARVCGPLFRRVITMVKHWNSKHSEYLQSYHIEVLAMQAFNDKMTDVTWNIYSFFDKASKLIVNPLWYQGSQADKYLSYSDRMEAKSRLETARDKSRDAWYETYGERNNNEAAIVLWRQLFGEEFPAYG